jgi:hypothetical protein
VIGERKGCTLWWGEAPEEPKAFRERTIVWMQGAVLLDCKTRRAAIYGAATPVIQSNVDDL